MREFVAVLAVHRDALAHDRLRRRGNQIVIAGAGTDHLVGQAVELLIFRVAHDELVLVVPEHEGFGNGLDGVAQARIGVRRFRHQILVGGDGDGREMRLAARGRARDVAAQAEAQPMPVGMAQAKAVIEIAVAGAKLALDLAAQIVGRVKRVRDLAEGHGAAARRLAKKPEHRLRPMHMAAGEIPPPDAAAGQRLGDLAGKGVLLARGGVDEKPEGAAEQDEHQAAADENGDLDTGIAAPIAERGIDVLDKGELHVGLGDVAHGDEGVGAVGQRQAQHAGIGAEGGQRLLGSDDGDEIAMHGRIERRPGLDVSGGVGQKRRAAIGGGAFGQAFGKRLLPIAARGERLVLELGGREVGEEGELRLCRGERRALAMGELSCKAGGGEQQKGRDQKRDDTAQLLGLR